MDLCRFNVMKSSSDWLSALVSLGITTQAVLDSASAVAGDLHTQYLIQFAAPSVLPFGRRCFQLRRYGAGRNRTYRGDSLWHPKRAGDRVI